MILAYVTICLLRLHVCAPETAVPAPFETTEQCWAKVDEFMHDFTAAASPVTLTWKCGEET